MTSEPNQPPRANRRAAVRKSILIVALVLSVGLVFMLPLQSTKAVECELGEPVAASLGDGVTLHTCSWEKNPGSFVRVGPLQLVRDGILILELYTDRDGKLQGEYSSWSDDGVMMENGQYVDGLKHGEWLIADDSGGQKIQYFQSGVPVIR
jgi:hypothetical protein